MQQSMRRRPIPVTPRTLAGVAAFALAFVLATGTSPTSAQGTPADETEATTDVPGSTTSTGSAETSVTGRSAGTSAETTLRPRWVEPRRGDGTAMVEPEPPEPEPSGAAMTLATEPASDWRSGARVIVHAGAGETRLSALVSGMLERRGVEDVEQRVVPMTASTDQVRYFHAEDAERANALAEELELLFEDVAVRDLTFYRPLPENGALEVWLR